TRSPVDAGEDRAAVAEASSARFEPRIERAHWAGLGARAQGDADEVPVVGWVGLRASNAQQESIVATGEIPRRQFGDFAASKCGGEADEQDRTVASAYRRVEVVHRRDDASHRVGGDRGCPPRLTCPE